MNTPYMANDNYRPHEALKQWIEESNYIEGVLRRTTDEETDFVHQFLGQKKLFVGVITELVQSKFIQPDGLLRMTEMQNVRVGSHKAPRGGPQLVRLFEDFLRKVNKNQMDPFQAHAFYLWLHPYTDGNGRSGRLIWLWHLKTHYPNIFDECILRGFLHSWYYSSLSFTDNLFGDMNITQTQPNGGIDGGN